MGKIMNEERISKTSEAVYKLNKITAENILRWERSDIIDILKTKTTDVILGVYTTNYKNKKLRIYKKRYEVLKHSLLSLTGSIGPTKEYETVVILELIDNDGNSLYSIDASNEALDDLYESVRYQSSGAKDLIDDLLKD